MHPRWLALAALFAGASFVAASPIFVRLSETGPAPGAFWRAALAAPLLLAWALMSNARAQRAPNSQVPRARAMLYVALAGVFFAGDLIFWHWSIMNTSVANATFLATCAPIFVVPAAWLMFRARVSRTFLVGLLFALIGVGLLVQPSVLAEAQPHSAAQSALAYPRALAGDVMGLITAMFFACYLLAVSRARAALGTARIMAWSTTITALAILPVALWSGERFFPHSAYGVAVLAGLALLPQVIGQSLIAYALAHLPATFSSVGLLLEPVVAALLAWLLLSEAMSAQQWLGSAAVLGGILLAHKQLR